MQHRIGGVFGDIGVIGEDGGDGLADIAHAVTRQHRLAIGLQLLDLAFAEIDRSDVGDVRRRPDGVDPGKRQRGGDVDGADAGMRLRRAHDAHVELMGEIRYRRQTGRGR